ncbi:hypothetical protein HWN40_00005 [Methanolobus zinderi]|uniref:Flagellin n=1 Tax=Methanolobus zinderi TaxID=536044 RepID=A0A7D5E582_9EURY|nr:hypothetical protein [Methanolobus zinderi]QLC48773.1 hypothetical protein HWN40_00005 [Methanolobus zinderi]
MRSLTDDENAVSISIGFILTFSITVLVLVTILTSFYSLMDQAEQTVMRDEYEIHGNDIAVKITTIDTMAGNAIRSGSDIGEIRYSLSLPEKIAGQTYSIEFSNTTNDIVFASEDRDETRVKIPFSTEDTTVLPTTLYSSKSEYSIVYNPDARTIEIS